jgi:hypothetical protein
VNPSDLLDFKFLIVWIPAYFANITFNKILVTKKTSGHEYLLQLGVWVAGALSFSKMLSYIKIPFFCEIIIITLLLVLAAYLLGICIKSIYRNYSKVPDTLKYNEHYFKIMANLLGQPIQVTLKNKKVYIGDLVDYTDDPNDFKRYVILLPHYSGYRDDELKLKINNYYGFWTELENNNDQKDFMELAVVLPESEIGLPKKEVLVPKV